MKRVLVAATILPIVLLSSCVSFNIFQKSLDEGEPDRTGSWSQINQPLKKPENWQQIVIDSEFQLGKVYKEWWEDADDDEIQIPKEERFDWRQQYGTFPVLDGSTVCVPMAAEFVRQHLGFTEEEIQDYLWFSTTSSAYEKLIKREQADGGHSPNGWMEEKPVELIIVTEPSENILKLADRKNVNLLIEPVCYDAFVFITHRDNPVVSLTIDQIQGIYSGEITNWKEVGGEDKKIEAYQREKDSGSQTAMEQRVMQGKKMLPPNMVKVAAGMGMLVDVVGEYQNDSASLGYTFRYYIDNLYKSEEIKMLSVEGVDPNNDNIRSQSYPFWDNYYAVIREEDEKNTGGEFQQWLLGEEGQKCIEQAGYIPIQGMMRE